jgi:gluconolactonase
MPIEIVDDAFKAIVSEGVDFEELASGFGGQTGPAEGPIWFHEGNYLLFSDIHGSKRYRYDPGKGVSVDKEETQHGNGQTRDLEGRLVVCHHYSRRVDREEKDGSITVIADQYKGYKLNRPNDVVVKSDGAIYFSDPPPKPPFTPWEHTAELDVAGVYRVSPDLKTINRVLDRFVNPNGLCFSPDEKVLYVNDSNTHRKLIMAYDVEPNGSLDLGSERLVADMKRDTRRGHPDGMKCDIEGNLYCTGPGGIWVIDKAGVHIGTILSDVLPINMAWGDDDWKTLYFTGLTTLNRIRLDVAGVPVPRGGL